MPDQHSTSSDVHGHRFLRWPPLIRDFNRLRPMYLDLMMYVLIPFLIPLGFLCATISLLSRLQALRRAGNRHARNYWRCSVVAHLLFVYAVLVLTLLAADSLLAYPWGLAEWWPSAARHTRIASEPQFLVLLDVSGALVGALAAMALARCFGYVDEGNTWHPPRRLTRVQRGKGTAAGAGRVSSSFAVRVPVAEDRN